MLSRITRVILLISMFFVSISKKKATHFVEKLVATPIKT